MRRKVSVAVESFPPAPRSSRLGSGPIAIYALVDPVDWTVRYIGKAVRVKKRYRDHCAGCGKNRDLDQWVYGLRRSGLKPALLVLRRCGLADWERLEREMISKYQKRGRLYNLQPGGRVVRAGSGTVRRFVPILPKPKA